MMLDNPTIEKLKILKLTGMLKALEEQMSIPGVSELDFFERLALMVDREIAERENRRLKTRLKSAKLRQSACIEDITTGPHEALTEDSSLLWRPAVGSVQRM